MPGPESALTFRTDKKVYVCVAVVHTSDIWIAEMTSNESLEYEPLSLEP